MLIDPEYGSHLPVLIKLVSITDGPILEFGLGMFSTPFLHWSCHQTKRSLVSYDNSKEFCEDYKNFNSDFHKIVFVDDWDKIDLSGHYSVVLIDHAPSRRRKEEVRRLANSADYIVIHDSQREVDRHYRYSHIYSLFKYVKEYNYAKPHVTILSNFKDLTNL